MLLRLFSLVSVVLIGVMTVAFLGRVSEAVSSCASTAQRCGADTAYAAEYFDGLVKFDKVLAGRRDLPARVGFGARSPKTCSFAIVALSADAPTEPPKPRIDRRGKAFRWGFLSRARRLAGHAGSSTFDEAYFACSQFWTRRAQSAVREAMNDPTAAFSDGPPPGEFFLYSAKQRVAMRLRYAR